MDADTPNLVVIVEAALRAGGYDGLYSEDECACLLGDLMPCDNPQPGCMAGYKTACGGDCIVGGCDYHVGPSKPGSGEE